MSQHPLLNNLSAALETPSETTLEQLKSDGWFAKLWLTGHTEEYPNGQVAISISAREIEGAERPVLFVYVDETQARQHNPDEELITYPLSVIGLLAQQQVVDLTIVDGDEHVVLSHEQFITLRDFMQLDDDPDSRNKANDDLFLRRFETFMQKAVDYCLRMPEVTQLHLACIEPGGAPMLAGALLEARNKQTHQKALQELFEQKMAAGDRINFLDPLDFAERKLVTALRQVEPTYVRREPQGWLARLFSRRQQPQLVVLELELNDDSE
jgi:hypothetical protein